jgi:hypothetical protein
VRGPSSSRPRPQVVEAAQGLLQVRDRAVVVDEPHEPELVLVHRDELDELLRGLRLARRRASGPQPVQRNPHLCILHHHHLTTRDKTEQNTEQLQDGVMYFASRAACCTGPTGLLMGYGLRSDWRLVGHCYKAKQPADGEGIEHHSNRTSYGCFPFFLL